MSQFIYESRVRAGRTHRRMAVAPEMAMTAKMALARRLQKVHVLGLRSNIPDVSGEHSVHDSPISHTSTPPKRAYRTDFLYSYGRHFWGGGVGYLEGEIVGEALGDCRKPYVYSDFSPTIHHPRTTCLGPPRRRVVCWTTRTGFLCLAQLNLSILPVLTVADFSAFTGQVTHCPNFNFP
jgi:hypothetical protein